MLLGDANAILQMLQNTGVVHSIVAGDRLEDKAVKFIKMMFDQAGVGKADSASVLTGKLFEAYQQTALEIERTLTEKVEGMLNALGEYWKPVALPDTQKFPMQATFEVYADHYACIGFDQLNEFGQGANKWILFLIIDTENCRTRNLIGSFTESTYRFDYKKFAEFLPALIEWTTPNGNSIEPPTASGTWSTYPRFSSRQTQTEG
ncbi:hypothetical protein D3C71_1260650 [compost metagenome]